MALVHISLFLMPVARGWERGSRKVEARDPQKYYGGAAWSLREQSAGLRLVPQPTAVDMQHQDELWTESFAPSGR